MQNISKNKIPRVKVVLECFYQRKASKNCEILWKYFEKSLHFKKVSSKCHQWFCAILKKSRLYLCICCKVKDEFTFYSTHRSLLCLKVIYFFLLCKSCLTQASPRNLHVSSNRFHFYLHYFKKNYFKNMMRKNQRIIK